MLYHKTYLHKDTTKPWITFVHGAGGSSSIWFSQIRAFSNNFNLLLIDLRGHGKSKSSETIQTYNFDAIADDVIDVVQYLNISKTHFIGISLGTIVIMNIAHRHPKKTISLVMGGAILYLNLRAKILMKLGVCFKHVIPYMWLYMFFAYTIMPKKNHKTSRQFFTNEAKKMNQKEFINWFSLVSSVNNILKVYRDKSIEIPSLYIMGAQDYMFLPSIQKIVLTHANASLCVIPNCGHVVNIDASEIFNKKVKQYLS